MNNMVQDRIISTVTRYGLDSLAIESQWRRDIPHPSRPALGLPTSYTMGTRSFLGVKWLGNGINHPPPPSIEVKERVELYHYLPLCLHGR